MADFSTRNSLWNYRNNYEPRELYDKNLLIIGFGRIGKKLGKLAKAFGMNILVYDPFIEKKFNEYKIRYFQNLKTALSSADCISLNLTKVDKPIITKENSQYLKHGVIIINTARGGIINEIDLANAIRKKIIGGAGIDVASIEPPKKSHPYYKIINKENFLWTPDTAWASDRTLNLAIKQLISNIDSYYKNKPKNLV